MKNIQKITAILIAFGILITLASCTAETPKGEPSTSNFDATVTAENSLWSSAVYTEDQTFGSGKKEVKVEVVAEDRSVTFTVLTDKENLADALLEHKLIEGEDGPYGIYIKKVNGILADYDVDATYWALSQDGTALMSGASDVAVSGGEHFELVRTKG